MPETVEKPKFLLLEAIMDLIDGKIGQEELEEALERSRQSLEEVRSDFEEDLADLEDRVKEGARDEISMVQKFFGDWENAFHAIEEYFHTQQKFDLIRAGEMVKRCSEGMNFALENYKNQVMLVMGPTDIPNLNMLIATVNEVKDGAPKDKLKKITADEFIIADGAIKELEFERKYYQYTEQELLIKAYKELQDAMSKIGHFIVDDDEEMLEKGLEECQHVYPKIKELIPLVNYKRMIQAPTPSPSANLLLNMAAALKKGTINEGMFIEALKESEDEFNLVKTRFEALARHEIDSPHVEEEVEKALEALDLYERAINDYYVFLDNREGLYLDQAEWELKEAAEALHKSLKFFDDLAEKEGKTPCVKCGHYNLPDRKTCEKCGAILPKSAGVTAASTINVQVGAKTLSLADEEPLPENLERMFTAVNQIAEGEISPEEFEETINWLQGVMETHKAAGFAPLPKVDLEKMEPEKREKEKKLLEEMKEVKQLFEEAYRDWEEGLDYFREYLHVGDQNLLIEGVKIMYEGNKKLNEVKNRTRYLVPEEQR